MDVKTRLMSTLAVFQHDLGSLASSWLVRVWLALSGLAVLFVLATQWRVSDDSTLIAQIMFFYLVVPWFLVAIMLGVGPVAGNRAESLSDGVLCRPVTRHEYLLASWAARVIVVLGVFLVVVVPAILLVVFADRPESLFPATCFGILAALFVVCLVLTLQVSLAFLMGTLLRRQMVTVALLAVGWLVSAAVLGAFKLEEFSPFSLSKAMPVLLCQPWREEDRVPDAIEAEKISEMIDSVGSWFGVDAPPPPKKNQYFDREAFADISLWRVSLGYGIPTLLSIGLATLVFCRRDL